MTSTKIIEGAKEAHPERLYQIGDRVRKSKDSSWHGVIVGFYSTDLTPIGYCVESEREPGSVQVYPEAALEAALAAGERPRLIWEIAFPGDNLVTAKSGHAVYSAWEGTNESYWTDGHHSQKRTVQGNIEQAKTEAEKHHQLRALTAAPASAADNRSQWEPNGDDELPHGFAVEDATRQIAVDICDAVLQWIVKHDLGQADDEFTVGDVTSILDDIWGEDDDRSGDPKAAEDILRRLVNEKTGRDPIQIITDRMAERGLTNVDLYPAFDGRKSRVSEVLNRKRPLLVKHIRRLSALLDLPASDLIAEYELDRGGSTFTIDT